MKTLFTCLIALILTSMCLAQTPINYKAIIKDTNGAILANEFVDLEFTILNNEVVYREQHLEQTDANGLVILNIGFGDPLVGTFADIDWGKDDHFLNVKIDIGNGFAVPYAYSSSKISESPNRTLEVAGQGNQNIRIKSIGGSGQPQLEFFKAGSSTDWRLETSGIFLDIEVSNDDFATSQGKFTFRSNGRLGVNTLSPSTELDVNGSIRTRDLAGTGTRLVSVASNGNLIVDTTPKVQYLSINPFAFRSANSYNGFFSTANTSGESASGEKLFAPINLPHGAVITKLKVYFTDTSTSNLEFKLASYRHNLFSSGNLSEITTTGSVSGIRELEIGLNRTINNTSFSYYIQVSPVDGTWVDTFNLNIKAVVITYEMSQ